jgi:hypothetical protein
MQISGNSRTTACLHPNIDLPGDCNGVHISFTPYLPLAMESQSLRTASSYINNLLLSRGLLRNGSPIEFARPQKAEGGLDATMGKIMNLVHDLILRRDVSFCFAAHSNNAGSGDECAFKTNIALSSERQIPW